ncbi:MAG: Gfo/Idh/MocA family oxidoreductase [Fimbriimonadaceae bacterium]|nr:Gfo/Idh/MocA family oxidoreductase [Chthonomonadaceae bacterium]MCO5298074.1 Gfo/Idh/MocA family oxidoreductase [Fimbriimonadaceae bacterium]
MDKRITLAIVGCGARGNGFSKWAAELPDQAEVVAIAEPRERQRALLAERHRLPQEACFSDWQSLVESPRLADAAIDATPDREHHASSIALMKLGYHLLLEKPMATTLEHCREIDRVRAETGRIACVCHSLRYQQTYARIKELLADGAIGRVMSIDQLEAVEHIHMSHSFVRGNWSNEARSTFMLLAKSCHDVDILAHLAGAPCVRASSFGSLSFFTAANAPVGAPARCLDGCPAEAECPYHAMKIYGDPERIGWGHHVGFAELSYEERLEALRTGPYGRCVFHCDNDVVDHQVLALEFEGGTTATFTMTAFTPFAGRYLRVHGTHGYLASDVDKNTIDLYRTWGGAHHERIELPPPDGSHGGGDDNVMSRFVEAVRLEDPSRVLTPTDESLRTHAIAFAGERSRRERRVVEIEDHSTAPCPSEPKVPRE